MPKPHRFGTALSVIAIAAVISGCAVPGSRSIQSSGGFGGKSDTNLALALRAQAALEKKDYATAIDLSERAVDKTPNDAGYRALLGNAYFAGGRFASAEAAYKDSLSLISNQPPVILKLVLVTIAQGKKAEALSFLAAAQDVIDAADYGLALALAGESSQAIMVLEASARNVGADARVRQNLALAHAIAGDWESARIVASQDLGADAVDARLKEWMNFANPARASDQVASLVGIVPASIDPGQPTRLALRRDEHSLMAAATPVVPESRGVEMAQAEPVPQPAYYPAAEALPVAEAPAPMPAFVESAPAVEVKPAPAAETPLPIRAASFVPKAPRSSAPRSSGKSNAVVQIGAYSSRDRVAVAWNQITKRYPGLRSFEPVTARFDGPRGTVYRLSVKGFASQKEALARCQLLRSKGGSCFVRSVAGDAPVQMASR